MNPGGHIRKNHDTLIGTGSVTQEDLTLARVLYSIDLWTITGGPQGLGNSISEVYFQVTARGSLFVIDGAGLPEGERCTLYLEDETEADVMCEGDAVSGYIFIHTDPALTYRSLSVHGLHYCR